VSAHDRIEMQKRGAAELVIRARHFDQNSMAILKEMATNAANGNPTAMSALAQVKEYIRRHPAEDTTLSEDAERALGIVKDPRNPPQAVLTALGSLPSVGCKEDVTTACAILAIGPAITEEYVSAFCDAAGPWKETLLYGFNNAGDTEKLGVANAELAAHGGSGPLCAGHCLGMAKKIQSIAAGDVAAVGGAVGWEVGCG
jgi:hypothetical protein